MCQFCFTITTSKRLIEHWPSAIDSRICCKIYRQSIVQIFLSRNNCKFVAGLPLLWFIDLLIEWVYGRKFLFIGTVVDKQAYCNIFTILQLLATVPITSATCERSISTLRCIKTYLRNTMTQDRLNGLALMYVHRDKHINLDEVIELFVQMHPRRMRMADILHSDP